MALDLTALSAAGEALNDALADALLARPLSSEVNSAIDQTRSLFPSTTSGSAVIGDRGARIPISANFTIDANVFDKDDVLTLDSIAAVDILVIPGAGMTLYKHGTTDSNAHVVKPNTVVTIIFRSPTVAIAIGVA